MLNISYILFYKILIIGAAFERIEIPLGLLAELILFSEKNAQKIKVSYGSSLKISSKNILQCDRYDIFLEGGVKIT